ncbi:adenylate/guanylate cyclase domain-containing protein [Kiloniella sp. b19]|uniref:adenylate/guanylate cyclase domain-containing protein n=1 Tax=Kiloniella sp. GXU_MW_B19 TaxID=3141326 RepID=UPI0031E2FFFA
MQNVNDLINWMLREGRLLGDAVAITEAFGKKLLEAGIPLDRLRVPQRFANPILMACGVIWTKDHTEFYTIPRTTMATSAWIGSPFQYVVENNRPLRKPLNAQTAPEHSIYAELHEQGYTDFLAIPLPYGNGEVQSSSFVTRSPEGFSEEHVRFIEAAGPVLAAALEPIAMRLTTDSLLQTYLGHGPAEAVANGTIQRGEHTEIDAVVLFSDLRGFTFKSASWAEEDLLDALDDYFELVVHAVQEEGGDVLKFMGDGILTIFPAGEQSYACSAAVRSAHAILRGLEEVNSKRLAAGREELALGIGMNAGKVTFGNIGSPDRLDFTVIGPAVNLASRLQDLTKTIGKPVLATLPIAQNNRESFESEGVQEVRGVVEPVEVFSLKC